MPQASLSELTGPNNGLDAKIAFIQAAYHAAVLDPAFSNAIHTALGRATRAQQLANLYAACSKRLEYVPDPVGYEQTKTPLVMLREIRQRGYASGDCDDQSSFCFSALQVGGFPAMLRVVWLADPQASGWTSLWPNLTDGPNHIYAVAVMPDGSEIAFDTTNSKGLGAEPDYLKKEDF
jgi:hypothetical protein